MENHTAKHFVLQFGSLASLYLSLSFLLVLIFGLINLLFPDAVDNVWQVEQASSSVRLGIAMVLVFFPSYLILTRIVNKDRRKDGKGSYLGLTKWLIYLSILVGGAVLLGDLVAVIMAFLEGELTERFILKAGVVLLVVGSAFYYYLLDAKGYWLKNENKSVMFGAGASIVVMVSLAFGFANIETPNSVRELRLDETQVRDLQQIQWRIQDHLLSNNELPETLEILSLNKPLLDAPEDRPPYRYEQTENGFKLCATFAQASAQDDFFARQLPVAINTETPVILNPDNWEHGEGDYCFERVVKTTEGELNLFKVVLLVKLTH